MSACHGGHGGNGHLVPDAIPQRLQRRISVATVILLQSPTEEATDLQGADFLLITNPVLFPPTGHLGAELGAPVE